MDQSRVPVTYNIVKAKIKPRKWEIVHVRARETYKERGMPKFEIERWPHSQLFTGHAKELRHYQYLICIKDVEGPSCTYAAKTQTIKDLVCECLELEEEIRQFSTGAVTVNDIVTHTDECHKLPSSKIFKLEIGEDQNTIEVAQECVAGQ